MNCHYCMEEEDHVHNPLDLYFEYRVSFKPPKKRLLHRRAQALACALPRFKSKATNVRRHEHYASAANKQLRKFVRDRHLQKARLLTWFLLSQCDGMFKSPRYFK